MPASSPPASSPPPRRSVFINCPFDPAYRPLFRAMCFAVSACGHLPRCALDESDSAAIRFNRILDLITAADFSIHDLSRVELDSSSGLPRFNMPLELGADLALRLRGPARHRRRRVLVTPPLPGAKAIIADYAVFQTLAAGIVKGLRLDDFERLPHADFLYVVDQALLVIENARKR